MTGVAKPHATLSYTTQEALRGGSLLVEAAEALGVPPGRAYAALKAGEAVENTSGALVHPDQVRPPTQDTWRGTACMGLEPFSDGAGCSRRHTAEGTGGTCSCHILPMLLQCICLAFMARYRHTSAGQQRIGPCAYRGQENVGWGCPGIAAQTRHQAARLRAPTQGMPASGAQLSPILAPCNRAMPPQTPAC